MPTFATVAFALLLVSPSLLAQPLDRNGDGYVSRPEALADQEIGRRFAQFDADGDGRLSSAELDAAKGDIARQARLDALITGRVKEALLAQRGLPSNAIAVQTHEGRVQLSGFVPAPDLVSRAGRVTAGVNGVRSVHNSIAVK